jgi:hypothetical protein
MRRRLQITLMASWSAISFLSNVSSTTRACAQSITSTIDESGRTIFVNDMVNAMPTANRKTEAAAAAGSRLMYWSVTEHRFKPVPTSGAVMRAARSAASEVNTYLDGRAQTHQTLNRAAFTQQDIDAAIEAAATRHNVDPNLVRSVVKVESNFNPNAVSRKGAMGLMQLMPSTARSLNVSNPFDPQQNVDAGVRHLRKLLDSYGGNVSLTLAAYNAGSGAVARSAGVPHFRETQNYVRRITNLYNGGSEPGTPHHIFDSQAFSGAAFRSPAREPVVVERDARGVLHMSNTD